MKGCNPEALGNRSDQGTRDSLLVGTSSPTLSQGHGLPSISTCPARAEMLRTRCPCTKQHHFPFEFCPPSPPPPTCVEDTSNFPVIQTRTFGHLPNTHPLFTESGVDPDHFTSHTGPSTSSLCLLPRSGRGKKTNLACYKTLY